jgi:predicted AlkP superfamily phosphohydrolase/phosphomutase
VIHRAKEEAQQQTTEQVLVIGLDGATFDLIEPWAEAGHLPNLARLMAEGAWGRMQSTVPAHSAPAWSTFATGLLPGRHGIYYFVGPSRDSKYFRPVSSESIHGRTLWELIGEQGRRVGTLNVPMTYPPRPVNGYLIAGMLSPDARSAFWPPELYEEVVHQCGDYVLRVAPQQDRRGFLEKLLTGMEYRCQVAEYLMEHHPVDFFMVVFRMIDTIMHRYWADMDPHHPLHASLGNSAIPDAILTGYRLLDEAVGRLVAKAGSDTTVFLMSDHGFRAEYRCFAVNKWLRDRGLLTLRRGRVTLLSMIGEWTERLHLEMALKAVARQVLRRLGAGERHEPMLYQSVDWLRTRIVFGQTLGFYINLQGRDFYGVVPPSEYEALRDRLIQELKAVRDPETGLPVVAEVYRREEIYEGKALDLAPDLIPEMAEYTTDGRRWGFGPVRSLAGLAGWRDFTLPSRRITATHASEGIFIAHGPHIRSGEVSGLHIADIAPTALYVLGLAIPSAMDGQARTELFDPQYVAAHLVQYEDMDIAAAGRIGQVMSDEDEGLIEERLRSLGYL